jgi:hypothetical protein
MSINTFKTLINDYNMPHNDVMNPLLNEAVISQLSQHSRHSHHSQHDESNGSEHIRKRSDSTDSVTEDEGYEDSDDEQFDTFSLLEEEFNDLSLQKHHKKVAKRAKKARIVLSKEYFNDENKDLVNIFYELSRAYFKVGDHNRGLHFGAIAKILRTKSFPITSGAQALTIKGIGHSTKKLIDEFLATKHLDSRFLSLRERIASLETEKLEGKGLKSPKKKGKIEKV